MGNVLYELHMEFEPALIGPFAMVIFIAFFPKLCEKLAEIKGEDYAKDFAPMSYGGHHEESFCIKNVYFEYSDNNIQAGYHNTKSHGGVVRGNGQYLKVGYVYYNSAYGNIIVYIEE